MKNALLLVSSIVLLGLSACKKDEQDYWIPPGVNEEELITTFKITFTDTSGIQPTYTAIFKDIDGTGGNQPSLFDTIKLKANTVYSAKIDFLNESVSPVDTITNEILEEAADHLICFSHSNINASILKTDSDGIYEIGLSSLWTISAASNGNVIISLKHQPGIKNGLCDLGETDIELNFQVKIE
ncbi:MAG: hypothetical protein V4622_10645 [Bacteroidota bacterium]